MAAAELPRINRPRGMHKVLVLDANQRSALAIIRSLGRHGLKLVAGDHMAAPLAAASRHASDSVRYPNPAESPQSFVREIAAIAGRLGIDTIIPASDLTTMLLASQPDLSQGVRLACPAAAPYEALTDKAHLLEIAGRVGVRAPDTEVALGAAGIKEAARSFDYPLVLKPARSRCLLNDRVVSTSVLTVRAADQLDAALAGLPWLDQIPCLVQRFVPGEGAGVFALHGTEGPLAWFAHRRIREKPPTGGVSVLSESMPVDSVMQSAALKLLSAVGWVGVAMVEFRVAPDGTAFLMEVNGRFWGSLQLAIDCGVDFPWLLYRLFEGIPVPPPDSYVIGRRLRWVLGDLDSLIIKLRSDQSTNWQKMAAAGTFLRSFLDPRCRQEVFRLSDPAPGLREARHWVSALAHPMG